MTWQEHAGNVICLQHYLLTTFTKYLQYFETNSPSDFDNYKCKSDDVKLIKPLWKLEAAEFKGIGTTLIFIMVRGDFLPSSYDENNDTVLYCTARHRIL